MFDISWTEFLLIGAVALIVIGPKELPGVMRTLGQYTRKIRSMAGEFQNQFQEAMREAEMTDLKKSVDDLASDIKNYDPLKDVREGVASLGTAGADFEKSLDSKSEPKNELTSLEQKPVELRPDYGAPADLALPSAEAAAPSAATASAPEPVTAAAVEPASTERAG